MDNEQNEIQKILKRRKLEAVALASSKFRDALESCEKLPKDFDCNEDYDYDYDDYYDYVLGVKSGAGAKDYEDLQYWINFISIFDEN